MWYSVQTDMKTDGSIIMSSENRWNSMRFRRFNTQLGVGFELNRDSQDLLFYDWDNERNGFTYVRNSGEVSFSRQILISGRRLYIQSGAPAGATAGDIWIQ